MNWIRRQILNAAPLTTIILASIFTHKWWAPYLDITPQSSTQLIAPSASVHLALGNPSGATTSVSNPDNYLMIKPQYALSYNRSKGTANWVSWELNKSWLGKVDRQNDFRPDETLPSGWEKVTPSVYSRSGYDKGHIAPSGDRTTNAQDNSQTFLMTNMMPQTPDNNRHTWESLEVYRTSPFKVVKFGTKIGHFNIQKAQNLSGGFKMVARKQRIFVGHLERAGSAFFFFPPSA